MGNRRIKYILLLVLMLLITSCGAPKEEVVPKQIEKEKKQTEEIPNYLFPGANIESDAEMAVEQSETSDLIEETKTVKGAKKEAAQAGSTQGEAGSSEQGKENQGSSSGSEKEQTITVSFDIESKSAEAYGYAVYYSSVLALPKGATVFDALASSGVRYTGDGYISGIEGLYEADCGQGSGWTYLVNGVKPNTGCQNYNLSDGDAVQWSYVLSP